MGARHHLCGKRVFKNRKTANRRCQELKEETQRSWIVYRCAKCGLLHLSSKRRKEVKSNFEKYQHRKIESIKSWLKK